MAHSSPAAEPCGVSEKGASVNVEYREDAEVTSHDFGRKKDGLPPVEGTEEKTSHSEIRRRAAWLGEKQE